MSLHLPSFKNLFSESAFDAEEEAHAKAVKKLLKMVADLVPYNRQEAQKRQYDALVKASTNAMVDGVYGRWNSQESYDRHLGILKNLSQYVPDTGGTSRGKMINDEIAIMEAHPFAPPQTIPTGVPSTPIRNKRSWWNRLIHG